MVKMLLTGCSGFLGQVIMKHFAKKEIPFVCISRIGQYLNKDISKPFELPSDLSISTVVHCAGKAHSIPKTDEEKNVFYQVNYQGTINLCNAIDKLEVKPKAFIFISTVAVYGVKSGSNFDEKHPLNGDTPYAKSKIQAESFLQEWAQRNNIVLSILRLPLIVGPNSPGNLGAMISGIKSGKYLSIGNGDAKKSVVWAEDIAHIIPKLVEVGGIYNLTDGYHPSFGELEKAISKALNKSNPIKIPTTIAKVVAKVGDLLGSKAILNSERLNKITSSLTFDDSKARNMLGWNPTKVLDSIYEVV